MQLGKAAVSAARTARGECSWGRQPFLPRGLLGVSAAGEAAVSCAVGWRPHSAQVTFQSRRPGSGSLQFWAVGASSFQPPFLGAQPVCIQFHAFRSALPALFRQLRPLNPPFQAPLAICDVQYRPLPSTTPVCPRRDPTSPRGVTPDGIRASSAVGFDDMALPSLGTVSLT